MIIETLFIISNSLITRFGCRQFKKPVYAQSLSCICTLSCQIIAFIFIIYFVYHKDINTIDNFHLIEYSPVSPVQFISNKAISYLTCCHNYQLINHVNDLCILKILYIVFTLYIFSLGLPFFDKFLLNYAMRFYISLRQFQYY